MDHGERSQLTQRQRYWLEHLERCQAQGLTMKSYAHEQGLKVSALYCWKLKLKQRGVWNTQNTVEFAEVRLAAQPTDTGRYRLHFPGGFLLEWEGGVDEAAIVRLVRAWEAQR